MNEEKIVETEVQEIPPEKKQNAEELIKPEDMLDLLEQVNETVDGYYAIFRASRTIMRKLQEKGYSLDTIVAYTTTISKRCSDKAGEIINREDAENTENTTQEE